MGGPDQRQGDAGPALLHAHAEALQLARRRLAGPALRPGRAPRPRLGGLRAHLLCGTSPGSSTPRPTSGGTRTLPPGTTPGTTGGSASSPSARAGTTTTTPLTSPPATASAEAVRHDLDHRARPAVPGPCHQ